MLFAPIRLMRLLASGGQPGHRSTTLPPGQRPQPQDSHGSSSSAPELMLHSRHAADGAATLHLACCIQPVLYIAADAVAARDPSVTADALDTLSVLLQAGGSGAVAQAVQGAAPHLLWGIAKWASPLPEEVQKEAAAKAKVSKTLITTVGVSGSAPTGSQQGASPSNANGSDEPLAARVSLSSKTGMGSLRALWGGGSNGSGQGAVGGAAPLTQGPMVLDATQPTSHLASFPEVCG